MVRRTGKGTRRWTEQEKHELLTTGKVSGYEGHHINSVEKAPLFAGIADNIKWMSGRAEHFEEHRRNWRNPTVGNMLKRR